MARKKKDPQGQFEGMPAPSHLSGAGMSEHRKVLKNIGETAPMMIRAPESALSGISASRKILSQHDTGTSKGLLDEDERIGWEDMAFPDRAHHPVYGYLSHGEFRDNIHGTTLREYANSGVDEKVPQDQTPADSVAEYGSTAFELKPHMREHMTFTHGDSLGRDPEGLLGRQGSPGPTSRAWSFGADQVYTEMQVHPQGEEPGVDVNRDVRRAIHYRDDRDLSSVVMGGGGDAVTQDRISANSAEALKKENRVSSFLGLAGVPHEVHSIRQTEQYPLGLGDQSVWGGAKATPGPVIRSLDTVVTKRWKPGQKWEPRTPKRGAL